MDNFRKKGVTAKLHPQFPTKTFPNHYSIITGLYPESHGIVGNVFYDPELNRQFSLYDSVGMKDAVWWGGDPLWNLANRSGLITASYYWPGSEAYIGGLRPNYVMTYNASVPSINRVEKVLSWLDAPSSRRPSFITMYFSDVDSAGHKYGPDAHYVADAVSDIDRSLGTLFYGIDARQSVLDIHTIVVSDHGMQLIYDGVYLDRYLPADLLAACNIPDLNTPSVNIFVAEDKVMEVYNHLKLIVNATVYLKTDVPQKFHFNNSKRIAPILVVADIGYLITTTAVRDKHPALLTGGSHGWDPIHPNMTGIFLAQGSSFEASTSIKSFQNIEVYNIISAILGLTPSPNNGTSPHLPGVLKSKS
jgi:predicted AlkP superfamily pyrophosphatase or phosphodiesterase